MQIQTMKITEIHPYEKDLRYNDDAVKVVTKSIKVFDFQHP